MNELKPCPWCKNTPELIECEKYGFAYYCGDSHTGTHYVEIAWHRTEAEARETWNNRPADDEPETAILLERQAKVIKQQAGLLQRMDSELAEARARIKEHCKDCRDFRGSGPAQCRVCVLRPYKEPERWKTELVGNWDEGRNETI